MLSLQSCLTLSDPMDYIASQTPLSMEFSRKESWSQFPCPPPGDLPNPGIKPVSLVSPAFLSGFFTTEPPGKTSGILFNLKKGGKVDKGYNMAEP